MAVCPLLAEELVNLLCSTVAMTNVDLVEAPDKGDEGGEDGKSNGAPGPGGQLMGGMRRSLAQVPLGVAVEFDALAILYAAAPRRLFCLAQRAGLVAVQVVLAVVAGDGCNHFVPAFVVADIGSRVQQACLAGPCVCLSTQTSQAERAVRC